MNRKRRKMPLFHRLVLIANLFAAAALVLSYGAAYINPEGPYWWLQLFGLAYGIILLLNFIFILYWIFFRKYVSLVSATVILVGASRMMDIYNPGFSGKPAASNAGEKGFSVQVMSFNVRLFDLYNWFKNFETRNRIFGFLKEQSPGILCFQEYYTSERKDFYYNNRDTLHQILNAPYSHVEYTVTMRDSDHWGIATYSRYPIVNKKAVRFSNRGGNVFIVSDVVVQADTIRVINAHLESIRFKAEDYRYIENLKKDIEQDEVKGGLRILRHLKKAYAKRSRQVAALKKEISSSPYPVILCGDFNDTPSSYTYHYLSDGMKDAFRESGTGPGKTYAGLFPSFRIDYILYSRILRSSGFTTHNVSLSDHFPITCTISKKQ